MLTEVAAQLVRGLAPDGGVTVVAVSSDESRRTDLHRRLDLVLDGVIPITPKELPHYTLGSGTAGGAPHRRVLVICPLDDETPVAGWLQLANHTYVLTPNRRAALRPVYRMINRWRAAEGVTPVVFVEAAGEGPEFAPVQEVAAALEGVSVRAVSPHGNTLRVRAQADILNQQSRHGSAAPAAPERPAPNLISGDDERAARALAEAAEAAVVALTSHPPRPVRETAQAPAPPAATQEDELRRLVDQLISLKQRRSELGLEIERLRRYERELETLDRQMRKVADRVQSYIGSLLPGAAPAPQSAADGPVPDQADLAADPVMPLGTSLPTVSPAEELAIGPEAAPAIRVGERRSNRFPFVRSTR